MASAPEERITSRGVVLDCFSVLAASYTDRRCAVEYHLVYVCAQRDGQVGAVHDRVQECVCRTEPPAVADRRHCVADAFHIGLVEVLGSLPAEFGSTCGAEMREHLPNGKLQERLGTKEIR